MSASTSNDIFSADGERRQITVMFTDLVGFTPLTERLGEEAVFSLVKRLAAEQTAIIKRHGGVLQDFAGDGLMAVFGAPVAIEDSPLKACRAAVEIQQRIQALREEFRVAYGCEPELRVGLHAGPVIVGRIGDDKALGYNALGDAVNTAARVQTAAAPGTVYCTKTVAELISGFADITAVGATNLKGKSGATELFRLDGLRHDVTRFGAKIRRGLGALQGRRNELQELRSCLAQVQKGGSAVLIVSADAGLGKSRLLYEFSRPLTSTEARVLELSCQPERLSAPFAPFIELLRAQLGIPVGASPSEAQAVLRAALLAFGSSFDEDLPYLLNLLGAASEPLTAMASAELAGVRTREALLRLIAHWASEQPPLVLLVEDIHWADSASIELLQQLLESASTIRVMVVMTTRPASQDSLRLHDASIRFLTLEPLEPGEAANLVRERLGDLPDAVLETVVKRSEGNPLFAEEMASYLAERRSNSPVAAEDLPTNLENLIMDRVHRLRSEDRAVIQTASVVGRRFGTQLVAEVAPFGASAGEALPRAGNQGLILGVGSSQPEDPEYAFKHALIQDALYGSLLKTQRAELHAKTAFAIERRAGGNVIEFADILAHHYGRTADTKKAARYLALAGERSLRVFSLRETTDYLDRALALVDRDPSAVDDKQLAGIVINRMMVCCWDGDFGGQILFAERYLPRIEKLGPSRELSRTLAWLGEGYMNADRFDDATAVLSRALRIGESISDIESIAYAKWDILWLRLLRPDTHSMSQFRNDCEEILGVAAQLNDVYLETLTYYLLSAEALQRGDIGVAKGWADRSIALGNSSKYPPALSIGLVMSSLIMSAIGEAATALQQGRDAADASGGKTEQICAACSIAVALLASGSISEANAKFSELDVEIEKAGFRSLLAIVEIPKWGAIAAGGQVREAIVGLENAIALFTEWKNSRLVAWAHVIAGDIYKGLAQGRKPSPLATIRDLSWSRLVWSSKGKARFHYEAAIQNARRAETPIFLMQGLMGAAAPPIGNARRDNPYVVEARAIALSHGVQPVVAAIDALGE